MQCSETAFLSSAIKTSEAIENVEKWLKTIDYNNICIISGFQSEIERLVLDSLLKTEAKIIFVMAKKLFNACPQKYKEAVKNGRMLIITPYNTNDSVVTKQTARKRNFYVINHAQSIVVGSITPNGMLEELLKHNNKPITKLV